MKITGDRLRLSASDVANFVACQHLTRLDLLVAREALRRPKDFDIGFEDLVRRGEVHERTVLERFRADGREVSEIDPAPDADAAAARGTRSATAPTSSTRAYCWARTRTAGRRCSAARTSWSAPTCSARPTGNPARRRSTTRSSTPNSPARPRPARSRRPPSIRTCSPACRASGPAGCTWRWATVNWPR